MTDKVEIIDVAPRDGLQSQAKIVDTQTKITLIEKLIDAGIRRMEVGFGGSLAIVQTDTTWYSASIGEVQATEYEDGIADENWSYMQKRRLFDD